MNTPDSSAVNLQHVYTVSDRLIALQIQEGTLTKGEQIPYTALPGDQIWNDGDVFREGEFYGRFVDEAQSLIRIADQYVGQPFDLTSTTNPANYTLTSDTTPLTITEIFHKSKLTQLGQVGAWDFASPTTHTVYLELAEPLTQGETYTLDLATPELGTVAFTYQPEATRSEAVHVSHLGFDPDDPAKVAFLSTWMADDAPVEYEVGTPFWLIDTATGAKVYEGQIELAKAKEEAEDRRGRNYNGTDVYWMDFSDFSEAGEYQVLVDDIGTSYTFEIGEKTWEDAFYTSVRGLYHQRSGIALEQPYTDYERPRPFHPDDGVVVYQSTATLMDTSEGLNLNGQSSFDALTAGITDEVLSEAWGGWFDAGDWDRRIQHVSVSRDLLELAASNLDYFAQLDLNLPESDNTLPDVIDEALWGLDFFRRLQTSEGGIRGGVESAGHPRGFEASWQESQTVMAYAPDMWSSYLYAGVAAQAAHVLQNIDPVLSQTYAESSIRAMGWAEAEYAAYSGDSVVAIDNARNLAAAELYRLTGEEQWHELFLDTTIFKAPGVQIYQDATTRGHETAAWVYSQTAHTGVNVQVQANARAALLQEADTQISWLENTGFKWNKHAWAPLGYGSLGAPDADTLIRAHQLTGEEQYLEAAILATQFAAGANPDNMVYTTGLGHRSPQDPLVVDARATGNEPPPGITVYGPLDLQAYGWQWGLGLFDETLSPDPFRWPTTEAYFDAYFYIPATEFTVQQTIAPTAYTWGYLAAVDEIAEIPSDTENPIDSTPTPPAIPPIAQNDAFTTDEDTVVRGNVLTNDSDPDSPSLTVTLVSGAANGDLQLTSDGSFEYNPTNNFNGTDSFIYEVSDGELTDKATVTININRTDTHLDLGSDELPVDTEPEKPLPPTGGIDLPADGVQETPTDNVQDVIGEYGSLSLNHQWQTIS
ncbi:MAG: glycoside hydrolase family 9 protein, partial [Cyanobacteria bacterium P01_H01_bin.58]